MIRNAESLAPHGFPGNVAALRIFPGVARVRVSPECGLWAALGNCERSTRRNLFERQLTDALNWCCRPSTVSLPRGGHCQHRIRKLPVTVGR